MSKNYHADCNGFVFYKDWEKYIDSLSDEEAGQLIKSVVDFAARAEIPAFSVALSALSVMFSMMQDSIDRDGKKWEKTCEANAKNGKKGGLAKSANYKIKHESTES